MEKAFPILLITLNLCAAIVYLYHGDIRHAIYWGSAGVLTASITF